MSKRWLAPIAVLLSALAIAACGDDKDTGGGTSSSSSGSSSGGPGEAQIDLTIGDVVPLTGDSSDFGPPAAKAADLAVAKINEAAKEAGADHTVKVLHEDAQGDPEAGVQAARQLVAEGAQCTTGSASSSVAIGVYNAVTKREGTLQIQAASTSDELTGLDDPFGQLNRTLPPDSYQGSTLVSLIEKAIGDPAGKTVSIGVRNDSYGTGLGEVFEKEWTKRGGKIAASVAYDPKQPSFTSEAEQLVKDKPDAWVILDFPETYAKVGPALVRTGQWDPARTFAGDGLSSPSLADNTPAEALEGVRGVVPGAPDEGTAVDAFAKAYDAAEPADVKRFPFDAQNFDAAILCYLAAVGAGSTDGKEMGAVVRDISSAPGTKYTWLELPQAIAALQKGEDIDYEGASGSIEMNDAGDATAGVYDVYDWKGGKPDITDEVPVASTGG